MGFHMSLEFLDCGLDGSAIRVLIEYGVCSIFDGVFSCECGVCLMLNNGFLWQIVDLEWV